MQSTNHLLMIRPVDFKYNTQTAANNKFQKAPDQEQVQEQALKEFDGFVDLLQQNGVDVTVINDTLSPETPDSIFPNNWVSFHQNGEVFLYPMFSKNRRAERREDILACLSEKFSIDKINDLSYYENTGVYLEGTGSMVLDRNNKIAYACLSLRTNREIIEEFCRQSGFTAVIFKAVDANCFPIYHTNVMMCIGDRFAVVCLDTITDKAEQELVKQSLTNSGKEIIAITFGQMNHFAGNMLQIKNKKGESLLVMSEQAYLALTQFQIEKLSHFSKIIYAPLYTIEKNGGGSARCMLAEVHLPLK